MHTYIIYIIAYIITTAIRLATLVWEPFILAALTNWTTAKSMQEASLQLPVSPESWRETKTSVWRVTDKWGTSRVLLNGWNQSVDSQWANHCGYRLQPQWLTRQLVPKRILYRKILTLNPANSHFQEKNLPRPYFSGFHDVIFPGVCRCVTMFFSLCPYAT